MCQGEFDMYKANRFAGIEGPKKTRGENNKLRSDVRLMVKRDQNIGYISPKLM